MAVTGPGNGPLLNLIGISVAVEAACPRLVGDLEEVGMQRAPLAVSEQERVVAGLPFVESLARRMASTMPHSIDLGDLVQDGVLGLMDAAARFDEARGIKFETFAE